MPADANIPSTESENRTEDRHLKTVVSVTLDQKGRGELNQNKIFWSAVVSFFVLAKQFLVYIENPDKAVIQVGSTLFRFELRH